MCAARVAGGDVLISHMSEPGNVKSTGAEGIFAFGCILFFYYYDLVFFFSSVFSTPRGRFFNFLGETTPRKRRAMRSGKNSE